MKSNREVNRRKVVWFLLSGAGLLAGCSTPSGYKPTLPESCTWLKFPYTWICVDPKEGNEVPSSVTSMWDSIPLYSPKCKDVELFTPPYQWEDLERAIGRPEDAEFDGPVIH
jgi:hypothetical protein